MRTEAEKSNDPFVRGMVGDLARLELLGDSFFLGLDYDTNDVDDVDEAGPF